MFTNSFSTNPFMKSMYSSFPPNLEKSGKQTLNQKIQYKQFIISRFELKKLLVLLTRSTLMYRSRA